MLLLPGLGIYLLGNVPGLWRPRRSWFWWGGALVAPLLLYLFIPLRAVMGAVDLHGSYQNTWQGFWKHILAAGYAQTFFAENPLAKHYAGGDWLRLFQQQVGIGGLLLGVAGLSWLILEPYLTSRSTRSSGATRTKPAKAWVCLLLVFVTNLIFAMNYKVSDVEVYLLPALLCLALLIGAGVGLLGRLLHAHSLWAPDVETAVQAVALLLLSVGLGGHGLPINRSHDWAVHDYAVALAKVNYPPQSRVIALEGEATALKYMQQAEGLGLNATAIVADDAALRQQVLAASVAQGYPTYLTA